MKGATARTLLLALVVVGALLSGCTTIFDDNPDALTPTEAERVVDPTTTDRPSPTENPSSPTTTAPSSPTRTESTGPASTTDAPNTEKPDESTEGAQSTQTTTPTTSPTPTVPGVADLEQAVLQRRDLSADYTQFGEVSRVGDELSPAKRNDSVTEWHQRIFRRNGTGDGPLLVISSVRQYESSDAATAALRRRSTAPDSLNMTAERVQIADGTEITLVRFRPEAGTYGVRALYREGNLVFRVETLDPDGSYDDLARSQLLRMLGYLG